MRPIERGCDLDFKPAEPVQVYAASARAADPITADDPPSGGPLLANECGWCKQQAAMKLAQAQATCGWSAVTRRSFLVAAPAAFVAAQCVTEKRVSVTRHGGRASEAAPIPRSPRSTSSAR